MVNATMNKRSQSAARYNAKTYEQIQIRVKRGEKDRYKTAAAELGMSLNQLIITAVDRMIDKY